MKNYKKLLVLITMTWANFVSAECCLHSHPGAKPNTVKPITQANQSAVISNQALLDKVKTASNVRILVKLNITAQFESKSDKPKNKKTGLTFLQEAILERMRDTKTELVIQYEDNPYLVLDVDSESLSILARLPVISGITEYIPTAVSLSSNLDLKLQYIDIGGNKFNGYLKYYEYPADPKGLYWKLESYCATTQAANCLTDVNNTPPKISVAILLTNSDIKLQGVEISGKSYFAYLKRFENPLDPEGMYWKADSYRVLK
jgi:hypothetical protein